MDSSESEIMTIEDVALYLRIPISSAYKLAQDGKIPAQKIGKHWRFHRQTLVNWVAAGNMSFQESKSNPKSLDFS